MSVKPWKRRTKCCINEASRDGASTPFPALDIDTCKEGIDMPDAANIGRCGGPASEQNQNHWESIGELARALAEKAGAK